MIAGVVLVDALPPCRPTGFKKTLSVTRFIIDLSPPDEKEEEESKKSETESENTFEIPAVIPGAKAPPLVVPDVDLKTPFKQQREEIGKIYEDLPPLPAFPMSPEDTSGEPITLSALQKLAYANSPLLAAAAARVEQARGEAIQAGLYPNPEGGYQSDTVNTAATAGYHGLFANQTIVTADKLKLRQSVEWQDVIQAEAELRRVEIDLATAVRRNYVRAMMAQERLKFAQELAKLFQQTYEGQIDLVAGGEAAAYEPLQLRVFALEAQNAAIVAGNNYVSAWRQLAAVVNVPTLSASPLDVSPEISIPQIAYEDALATVLQRHTDLAIFQAQITRSEINLCLQQVVPVPNVDLGGVLQYDDTTSLNDVSFNLRVGVRLPVFDKNQGNIFSAESQIVESHHNLAAVQNQLTAELAEIYARYLSNQALIKNFRDEILPDQVRTYRGMYLRYREGADPVDFAQIVVTQQQVGQLVGEYLDALENQWLALVDLAEILQADNLFHLGTKPHALTEIPIDPQSIPLPIAPPDSVEK